MAVIKSLEMFSRLAFFPHKLVFMFPKAPMVQVLV